MSAAVLYMRKRDFVEKNPNTVQALVNAFYKTLQWIEKATPEQIADNVPKEYWLGDKALYMAAVKANLQVYSRDGIVSAGSQKRSLDFLRQFDKEIAPRPIDTGQDLGRPLREEGGGDDQVGRSIAVIPDAAKRWSGNTARVRMKVPLRFPLAGMTTVATAACSVPPQRAAELLRQVAELIAGLARILRPVGAGAGREIGGGLQRRHAQDRRRKQRFSGSPRSQWSYCSSSGACGSLRLTIVPSSSLKPISGLRCRNLRRKARPRVEM